MNVILKSFDEFLKAFPGYVILRVFCVNNQHKNVGTAQNVKLKTSIDYGNRNHNLNF